MIPKFSESKLTGLEIVSVILQYFPFIYGVDSISHIDELDKFKSLSEINSTEQLLKESNKLSIHLKSEAVCQFFSFLMVP